MSIFAEECPSINKDIFNNSHLTFNFWRGFAVLGKSTHDEEYFNIFNGLDRVMSCLTAEIYSWYTYGLIIELNCVKEKFQKSKCPGAYIPYTKEKFPSSLMTPPALMTTRPVRIIAFKPHKYLILYDCHQQKNGQLEEGLLVLVDDLTRWEYNQIEIELAITKIPFKNKLIDVSVDKDCQCLVNPCFFLDSNENIQTQNKNTTYNSYDLNAELHKLGLIVLLFVLVIILINLVIVIRKRCKKNSIAPIN
ncbi:unnamed protein product [Diamesa serratosioi]